MMPLRNYQRSRNQCKRITSLLRLQLFCMGCMGQTPSVLDEHFPKPLRSLGSSLMRLYSAFVVWTTGHTSILFIKTTFDMLKHGQLDEITDALTQSIIFGFACFSTCYWLWRAKALKDLIALINQNYWHQSLAGITFVSSFPAYERARRISLYWYYSALVGVISWGSAPLLQGVRSLPQKCWYPFDPLQSWVYPVVYSIQMFTQVNIGITFSCGSALYVSLIIIMLGQFDILFCSLKNLQHHAALISGEDLRKWRRHLLKSEDDEVNQYLFVKEEQTNLALYENIFEKRCFKSSLKESFKKCVELHRFIRKCCLILEDLFYPFCLVKSLQITIQLCLLVFVGVAGERSLMRLFTLCQYLALTIIELFMFCFCGELLKQHSTRSGEALFRSQWPTYAPLIQKDFLIFLVNSKHSIKLTAGKFFVMDLERLRSVVMQAFSFLTLLRKLAAKN